MFTKENVSTVPEVKSKEDGKMLSDIDINEERIQKVVDKMKHN